MANREQRRKMIKTNSENHRILAKQLADLVMETRNGEMVHPAEDVLEALCNTVARVLYSFVEEAAARETLEKQFYESVHRRIIEIDRIVMIPVSDTKH